MDSVEFSSIRRTWDTHILEHACAFVAGWGIKVGTATPVFATGCGMNEGRTPPRLLDCAICGNAAGGERETRGGEDLASLAGPSKRRSAVARGIPEGDWVGEAPLQETKGAVGKVRVVSSSLFSIAGS